MPLTVSYGAQPPASISLKQGFDYVEILGNKEESKKATAGRFSIDAGQATTFKYPCDEFTVILDGEILVEDLATPDKSHLLKAGDTLHVVEGSSIKWSSPSNGKGFYVALKPLGDQSFAGNIY